MEESATRNPDRELNVKIVLAEGDLVATCSHIRQEPRSRGAAVVHIFRFAGDKIVEMWDIGQDIPADSPNENGMF
jgi:predicted SnoaL-like aldol condensation-catalyzing enzyme